MIPIPTTPKNNTTTQGITTVNSTIVLPRRYWVGLRIFYLVGMTPPGGASMMSDDEALNVSTPVLRHTGAIHEC